MNLIREFTDGTILAFGRGMFDNWCVLLTNRRVRNYAPRDTEYFRRLRELADAYGAEQMYRDFVQVYDATDAQIRPQVLAQITRLAQRYAADALRAEIVLSILYAAMVAEENKHKAILKKRIKRLAVHQVLREGMAVEQAATFSRGKRWQEIAAECRRRGF